MKGIRKKRGTDKNRDGRRSVLQTEGVTGHESLRNTPNQAARGEGEKGVISVPHQRRGGWGELGPHCTHTHTHTDVFPCKQLGHAGRLGGRM